MTEQRIDLGLASTNAGGCGSGCGCGHGGEAGSTTPAGPSTDTLRVSGMTCEHCVRAVTEELSAVDGVEVVAVDLRVGGETLVRIASDGTADADALAAAIDEAGYTLVR